jgi:hypothetical protein
MISFLFLFTSLFFPTQALAQTTTASPSKAANKEVIEMVEKKVQDMLQQNDNSSTNSNIPKAIIGTISQINNSQITTSYQNQNKTINTDKDTVFIDSKKNKSKLENLKSGQLILALGYYDQYNTLTAKRIVVTSDDSIVNKNEIVLGQIVDVSQSSGVIVLIPTKNKNIQYQIKTNSQKTKVVTKNNIESTIDKLKPGQKVIVVIQPDPKTANTFNTSKIILLTEISDTSTSPTPTVKK